MKITATLFVLCTFLMAGCATKQQISQNYRVNMAARVDMTSVNDQEPFQKDLTNCADLAAEW